MMPRLTRLFFRAILVTALLAGLAGCTGLRIDDSVNAVGQDDRVQFIVLHYTALSREASLRALSRGPVSAHYLVTDDADPHVYRLVPESRRAWHAGVSSWYGRTDLNSSSIGIEIVNPGWVQGADGQRRWAPYSAAQVRTVIALLKDILQRHPIAAQNIVGHSDIAPQRKQDPGPMFPWRTLATQGLGRWFDEAAAARAAQQYALAGAPNASWFQQQLRRIGYDTPQTGSFDAATRTVISAFQMHYRPSNVSGDPDAQTAGILSVMPTSASAAPPR